MEESKNGHLDKAKAALAHAKELLDGVDEKEDISINPKLNKVFLRLIDLAQVQATVAQAAAQERMADALERIAYFSGGNRGPG